MLIVFIPLFICFGWIMGGRLSRLEQTDIRWLPLCLLSCLLELLLAPACRYLPWPRETWIRLPVCGSYLLIFLFLWRNRKLRKTALLAGLGSLCNFLVIAVNDFRMPVSQGVLQHLSPQRLQQLQSGAIPLYAAADGRTRLLFLGDIIPVPVLGGFASIGDLLLTAGLFFCLMVIMSPDRLPGWWKKG